MSAAPSPLQTVKAVIRGYFPRLFQGRGWAIAAIAVLPLGLMTVAMLIARRFEPVDPTEGIRLFHQAYVPFLLPILAIVSAPAGIREDIEQRTIPLLLVRPAPAALLPLSKGMLWYSWGALWLILATLLILPVGIDPWMLPRLMVALLAAHWAQLAFMAALSLVFKRGILWGALFCFVWDPLVRVLPSTIQRLTFLHYIESIAQSRGGGVQAIQILAQEQISTAPWLAVLVLVAFGAACWVVCGMKLHSTPIGLAGREAEG